MYVRVFICGQEVLTKFSSLYLEELWRLRPRRACEFECVILAGTSEGVAGLRVLEGSHCRCCGRVILRDHYNGNPSLAVKR